MKAGFARVEITPSKQMPMAGFDRREGLSAGINDPLYVSALLIGVKMPELVICSFDLLGVDTAFCAELDELISKKLKLARDNIIVCATHTHSGPAGIFKERADYDREYVESLLLNGLAAVEHAEEDFREVSVFYLPIWVKGIASPRNIGRRYDATDFEMKADILRFSQNMKNILLSTFVCHPTVLNERNLYYSRDLPGAAASCMRDGERTIFLNGPCADISTRYIRQRSDTKELARLGWLWSKTVEDAKKWINVENITVKTFGCRIKLSGRTGMEGKNQLELMSRLRERIQLCNDQEERREYLSRLSVLERGEYAFRNGRYIPIKLIDLGYLLLLCVSLEMSWSFGEKCCALVERALTKPVIIICYAEGYDGYLPSGQPLSCDSSYEDFASPYSHVAQKEFLKGLESLIDYVKKSGYELGF